MKTHLSLTLCFSLFTAASIEPNTLAPELATLGAGTALTAYGLKMIHKSTKEKGTSGQAIVGPRVHRTWPYRSYPGTKTCT